MKVEEISGVAVSSGPGAFTGLRIGLSAAKGIAYALDIPLFLIPTLDVFANYGLGFGKDICSIIPSIRGDIFYSFYKYYQKLKPNLMLINRILEQRFRIISQ